MAKLISSACDACRQRKVKCCGTKPQCSNCKSSDIPCKYDMPRRKRGPKPRDRTGVRVGSGPPHPSATSTTTPMEGVIVRTSDRDNSETHSPTGNTNSATAKPQAQFPAPAPAPALSPSPANAQAQANTPLSAPPPALAPALPTRLGRDDTDTDVTTQDSLHPRLPSIRADPIFSQLPSIHHRHDFGHAHRIAPWGPSPSSPRDSRPDDRLPSPTDIQRTLAHSLDKFGLTAERVAAQSIDTATSLLFGIIPIYHATSLSASISLLSQPSLVSLRVLGVMTPMTPYHTRILDDLRAFTLLTSFCAAICANANSSMLPGCDDSSIVRIFLRAARDMSLHYEDLDYEHPTSSSLIIKLMQSTAFHCLGKTHMSLCVMGDAYRLLLLMRLFDEQVVNKFPPAEAQALRNIYWSLHMIDKSASVLNDAPSMIHDLCLNQPTTVALEGPEGYNLLDSTCSPFSAPYEAQLHQGFYVTVRLFAEAGDIFLDLRILARMRVRCQGAADSVLDSPSASMMSAYMSFSGILDTLPRWLRDPNSHVVEGDEAATAFQRKAFWTQRANFLITFHCLRMVILRRAAKLNFCRMLGLIDDESVVALRKTDIAHDMVSAATSVPFEALKINGEHCVEKFRQVGLDLLEIQHKNYDSAISTRAKAIFNHLLDLIARLDSKVSNELAGDLMT